ncbi:hypothetical protein PDESU_01811 [Pontiella desulfatans]|uniref:TIR domain-containing protein n=1 Tax=Pontiella desulfatans TaxID=2750659 RepID=A0A6C2U059_PONDE|nr:toll/interleukin-1 receptor domain-containing protein [Pontiella desulfatans]VGO13255.1 hypothetical protein PDESU_01811 [Pontiella desulfatans]
MNEVGNQIVEKHKTFISHASEDAAVAGKLVEVLEARGFLCWFAPREIGGGADFAEQIINGLEQCSVMLLLLTRRSAESPHVLREVNHAIGRNMQILPVRVEEFTLTKNMAYYLSHVQWIDAFPKPFESYHPAIVEQVGKLLEEGRATVQPEGWTPNRVVVRSQKSKMVWLLLLLVVGLCGVLVWKSRPPMAPVDAPAPPEYTEAQPDTMDPATWVGDESQTIEDLETEVERLAKLAEQEAAEKVKRQVERDRIQKLEQLASLTDEKEKVPENDEPVVKEDSLPAKPDGQVVEVELAALTPDDLEIHVWYFGSSGMAESALEKMLGVLALHRYPFVYVHRKRFVQQQADYHELHLGNDSIDSLIRSQAQSVYYDSAAQPAVEKLRSIIPLDAKHRMIPRPKDSMQSRFMGDLTKRIDIVGLPASKQYPSVAPPPLPKTSNAPVAPITDPAKIEIQIYQKGSNQTVPRNAKKALETLRGAGFVNSVHQNMVQLQGTAGYFNLYLGNTLLVLHSPDDGTVYYDPAAADMLERIKQVLPLDGFAIKMREPGSIQEKRAGKSLASHIDIFGLPNYKTY